MGLPTFVGVGTPASDFTGAGNIFPGLPSGWAENDILLCFVSCEAIDDPSCSWTYLDSYFAAGTYGQVRMYWKRATASESAPNVWSGSTNVSVTLAIRGCPTAGSPFNTGTTQTESSATNISAPGATTTVPNCMIVAVGDAHSASQTTNNWSSWANSSLANVTERIDFGANNGSRGANVGVATGELATAGTYNSTTATGARSGWVGGFTIALIGAGVPNAPTLDTVVIGDTVADLYWTAPAYDGGEAITGYTMTASPDSHSVTVGDVRSGRIDTLTNGTDYTFSVYAANSKGISASAPGQIKKVGASPIRNRLMIGTGL